MSVIQFNQNLESIYYRMNTYEDMRNHNRIEKLFNIVEETKDFRFFIPLFLFKDFDAMFFISHAQAYFPKLADLSKSLYTRTRRIALGVKQSQKNMLKVASYRKAYTPKIDCMNFLDTSQLIPDTLLAPINAYKMESDFFYEHLPYFNHFGPIYLAIKDKTTTQGKKKDWESLPIEERKICSNNCLIEYYIYTGTFPIEGKFLKATPKHNAMYLKPSVQGLRAAIRAKDLILLGLNLSEYEKLPLTLKKVKMSYIRENYAIIKQHTKRCDLPYLNAWRKADLLFKKENSDLISDDLSLEY